MPLLRLNGKSTTTRIETALQISYIAHIFFVLTENPLQQGLKLRKINRKVFILINVLTENPLQQGLKLRTVEITLRTRNGS